MLADAQRIKALQMLLLATHLLIGGGLITAANVLIQLPHPLTVRRLETGRQSATAAAEKDRVPGSLDAAREV